MAGIFGDNAFFATLYITDIPVISGGEGDYRQENRDLAGYVSNLFGESESKVVNNRGVERVVLPEVTQTYDMGLRSTSTMTPKVYTCGGQIFIAVDEKLDNQKSLSACEIGNLVDLMKDSSLKRHEICYSIYKKILSAGRARDQLHKNCLFDINAFETPRDKDAIIDYITVRGKGYNPRPDEITGLDDAYSILSSTGTDQVEKISAVYNRGVKIPLRCSNHAIDSNNRVITALTVSYGASAVVKHFEKDCLTQLSS